MVSNQTLARHLEAEMSAVPLAAGELGDVIRRGRRRRRARRGSWAAGALAVAFLFVMFPIPYDPNPKALAGSYEVPYVVEISDLEVAVESATPFALNPDVWIGWMHPRPEFDTFHLGPDLTFTSGTPSPDDLEDRVLSAVYLGEAEEEPFYIYSVNPPTPIDRVFEIKDGNLSGEILGTTLNCCLGGDLDIPGGFPGVSSEKSGDLPTVTSAEWIGLTPDVSVVAFMVDGEFIGWQTPVGGVVGIRLDHQPGAAVTLIAYGTNGEEMGRHGPSPMFGFDGTLGE